MACVPSSPERRRGVLLDRWDDMMSLLAAQDELTRANARITVYPDGSIGDCTVASHYIYRRPGWMRRDPVDVLPRLSADEWVDAVHDRPVRALRQTQTSRQPARTAASTAARAQNQERGRRRAQKRLREYIRANTQLDTFVTLTIDARKLDRYDIPACIRRVSQWLGNQVRRHDLQYVGVYELHKDGALHLHLLCQRQALDLVAAHNPRTGRALRHRDGQGHWHQVYNVRGWPYGYSTAIRCYGHRAAIAAYVAKYLRKGTARVGGRWYIHSRGLRRPTYLYYIVDYAAVTARRTLKIERPGAAPLWLKYTSPDEIAAHLVRPEHLFDYQQISIDNKLKIKKALAARLRVLQNCPCGARRASASPAISHLQMPRPSAGPAGGHLGLPPAYGSRA